VVVVVAAGLDGEADGDGIVLSVVVVVVVVLDDATEKVLVVVVVAAVVVSGGGAAPPISSGFGACSVDTVGSFTDVKPVRPVALRFASNEPSLAASVNFSLTSVASVVSFTDTLKDTFRSAVAVRERRRFDDDAALTSSTFTSVMSSTLTSIVRAIAMENLTESNWSFDMPVNVTDASIGVSSTSSPPLCGIGAPVAQALSTDSIASVSP